MNAEHPSMAPQLLTVVQAARYLGCSPSNMYALIQSGGVPHVIVGLRKGYRIDVQDLEAFVSRRKREKAAAPISMPRLKFKHIRLA